MDEDFEDFYHALGGDPTSTQKELSKAYRQLARTCHPDKTRDPAALAQFHRITKAWETLQDPPKRREYDRKWRARHLQAERDRELTSDRRDAKRELEMAEVQAKRRKKDEWIKKMMGVEAGKDAQMQRDGQAWLERLNLEREQQILEEEEEEEVEEEKPVTMVETSSALRVKWSKKRNMSTIAIQSLMEQFGLVEQVVIAKEGKGHSALVVFKESNSVGLACNVSPGSLGLKTITRTSPLQPVSRTVRAPVFASGSSSLVMHRLRQQEERQRLEAQALREEEEEDV